MKKATELSILCDADIVLSIKFNDQYYRFSSKKDAFEQMCHEACKAATSPDLLAQESHNDEIMTHLKQKELKEKEIQDCQQVYKRKKDELVLESDSESGYENVPKRRRHSDSFKKDDSLDYTQSNGLSIETNTAPSMSPNIHLSNMSPVIPQMPMGHFSPVQDPNINSLHRRVNVPPPTTVNSALPAPIIGNDMRVYQRTPPVMTFSHPMHSNFQHYSSPNLRTTSHFGGIGHHESPQITRSHFPTEKSIVPFQSTGGLGLKNDKQFYQSLSTQSIQSIENVNASYKANSFGQTLPIHSLSSVGQNQAPNFPILGEEEPKLSVRIPHEDDLKHPGPPVGYSPDLTRQIHPMQNSNLSPSHMTDTAISPLNVQNEKVK